MMDQPNPADLASRHVRLAAWFVHHSFRERGLLAAAALGAIAATVLMAGAWLCGVAIPSGAWAGWS